MANRAPKSFGERVYVIDNLSGRCGFIEANNKGCKRPWGRKDPEARSHAKRCEERSRNIRDAWRAKERRNNTDS